MRQLAVIHHRHQDWVPALQAAEPRLDIQGWHPRDLAIVDPAWLAKAEGLFCWKVPEGLVARMPKLAWVQNSGAGVDHLVHHPDLGPGIAITRADGAFGFWIARYTAAHLLMEAQRIRECDAAQAERRWEPKLIPEDLSGQRAVIVGFGRIGRQVGRALKEMGLRVTGIVRDPREDPDFDLLGLDAMPGLMAECRVLVLTAPLTDATRNLVNRGLLAHGHGGLTLINAGRGELIVEPDLIAALDEGRLRHAVLDVFVEEPLPASSPLWAHPKLTITPHHAGPSQPAHLIPDIVANLRRFAEGLPIVGAVDRARGY